MNAIEVKKLKRIFHPSTGIFKREKKEILAVDSINFSIGKGELFGLLGPNGAGKTTTVKMLTTLLTPTSGEAIVAGYDISTGQRQVQQKIGFIFGGERGLYWRLSAEDNLRYFASLYHVDPALTDSRIPELLELVGLKGRGKEKVEGYSRGMKQRLHVARTLLHDPEILFLDEPTIGLDPVGARDFRIVIQNLQNEGKTILLTTHYMYEADMLSDRIAVINHGKIIALDTPVALKKVVQDLSIIEIELFGAPKEVSQRVEAVPSVVSASVQEQELKQLMTVQTPRGAEAVPEIVAALDGYRIGRVDVREPTLEDAYIRLVSDCGGEAENSEVAGGRR